MTCRTCTASHDDAGFTVSIAAQIPPGLPSPHCEFLPSESEPSKSTSQLRSYCPGYRSIVAELAAEASGRQSSRRVRSRVVQFRNQSRGTDSGATRLRWGHRICFWWRWAGICTVAGMVSERGVIGSGCVSGCPGIIFRHVKSIQRLDVGLWLPLTRLRSC